MPFGEAGLFVVVSMIVDCALMWADRHREMPYDAGGRRERVAQGEIDVQSCYNLVGHTASIAL
jgi:hypothetical protein